MGAGGGGGGICRRGLRQSIIRGMSARYLHQLPDWPQFRWRQDELADSLAEVRYRQGRLLGRMESLGFARRQEAMLDTLTGDVVKSSEIEGEILDAGEVRSSIAWRLGMDVGGMPSADGNVEGMVALTLDATQNYAAPLTDERLFGWHADLFPTGRSVGKPITVGGWRDDAYGKMQVVSGAIGKERVHYEAPDASRVDGEMRAFLDWFNAPPDMDAVLKAGLAHLWFVIIHPFDDGNGRIARAISDMALARSDDSPQRFYSMSSQIRKERRAYYDVLERTQRETVDVTAWMVWFVGCLGRSIESAEATLDATRHKGRFRERIAGVPMNERQGKVIARLLDGFEGKLTTAKWARLAKCSHDTALRDITGLVERGVLARNPGGGRSASYRLVND